MKTCRTCNIEKPLEEYRKRHDTKDGRTASCKLCIAASQREHYKKHKKYYADKNKKWRKSEVEKFVDFLKTQQCQDCGESDVRVLEFDHISDKAFNIGSKVGELSFTKLMEEIGKCDVVCANCHKKRTAKVFGWFKHACVA